MRANENVGTNTNIDGIIMADYNMYDNAGPIVQDAVQLEQNQTYQIRPYENGFSRYINLRNLSNSQNLKWQSCAAYVV